MENYDTGAVKHATTKKSYGGDRTKIEDAPAVTKHSSKKDTRKWCKGISGRKHDTCYIYAEVFWAVSRRKPFIEPRLPETLTEKELADQRRTFGITPWCILYCKTCQKHIKYDNAFALRREGVTVLTSMPE